MNRAGLVDEVTEVLGDRRTAAAAVDAVLFAVQRAVSAGESVGLTGFGVFERVDRPARTARNPATGGTVQVAAGAVPRFRAGTAFREIVSGARALPSEPAPVAAAPDATTTRARPADPGSAPGGGPAPAKGNRGGEAEAPGKDKGKDKGKGRSKAGEKAGAPAEGKKAKDKAQAKVGKKAVPAKGSVGRKAGKRSGSTTRAKGSKAGRK